MKTRKKVLVAALAIALIAIAVGGSLAWFTDEDEATNVFTVGSIDIEQVEVFDEQTAQLLPVVGTDPTDADDNYIQKNVTVKNLGENEAYVQTYVAVPAILDDNGILKLYDITMDANYQGNWIKVDGDPTTPAIDKKDVVTIEGMEYNVYLYRYTEIMPAPTATAESVTDACLKYVYIDSSIDLNTYDLKDAAGNAGTDGKVDTAYFVVKNGTTETEITGFNAAGSLNVYVATQGVQARGFADAASALDSAFAENPWE